MGSLQSKQPISQDKVPHDSLSPPLLLPLDQTVPQASLYLLHGQSEYNQWSFYPAKFRMPDIEKYMGVGCLHIHLQLYSTVMRTHGLNKSQ
ncbi:hypothetical protein CK203_029416 [Vitis vinifera]|uniref:Uncharacterized protein n=1 Tax=Vitis vinifera TaxID=29760 RepID=A0A438HX18_VITVI|nr:hypothetical protein CK203_029416 [Vitis vinifera]